MLKLVLLILVVLCKRIWYRHRNFAHSGALVHKTRSYFSFGLLVDILLSRNLLRHLIRIRDDTCVVFGLCFRRRLQSLIRPSRLRFLKVRLFIVLRKRFFSLTFLIFLIFIDLLLSLYYCCQFFFSQFILLPNCFICIIYSHVYLFWDNL